MQCRSVRRYIERFGAPVTGDPDYDRLAAHINACPSCAKHVTRATAFDSIIGDALAAPVEQTDWDGLHARIAARVSGIAAPHVRLSPVWYKRPVWRFAPIGLAAALILAFGISLMLGDGTTTQQAQQPAVEETGDPPPANMAAASPTESATESGEPVDDGSTQQVVAQSGPDSPQPVDEQLAAVPTPAEGEGEAVAPTELAGVELELQTDDGQQELDTSNCRRVTIVGTIPEDGDARTEQLPLKQLVKHDRPAGNYDDPVATLPDTPITPPAGYAAAPEAADGGTWNAPHWSNSTDEALTHFDEIVALRLHIGALTRTLKAEADQPQGYDRAVQIEEMLVAWHRLAIIADDATTLDSAITAFDQFAGKVQLESRPLMRARAAELRYLKLARTE